MKGCLMTQSIKIAMFDTKPYDSDYFDRVNHDYKYEILSFANRLTEHTARLAEECQVVCAFVNDVVDATVIDQLEKQGVQLIALRCAGYNNVDLKTVHERIHVMRVPDYSPYAVAEHAVSLMLALNRKTHRAYQRVRENNFSITGLMGFDMHGKTAGIIGTGRIGRQVIRILNGFGMNVLAYDAYPNKDAASNDGFEYVSLSDIYAQSDILSLHCPLTKETDHLINAQTLSQMKSKSMIINTGRGRLIDSSALIHALKNGHIGSAGLDVYEEEHDYFFEDFSNSFVTDDTLARLMTFPNVIITSHQAFFTHEALQKIAQTTLQNISDFFSNQPLQNEVCYKACELKCCNKPQQNRCW